MEANICDICQGLTNILEQDSELSNYFIGPRTDIKPIIGKAEGGIDDDGIIFLRTDGEELTFAVIGRICYNLNLGPYGNYNPSARAGEYEFTTSITNARWTCAIAHIEVDDERFKNATKIIYELDRIIANVCMKAKPDQEVQINPTVDNNGAIKLMTKLVVPGSGLSQLTTQTDPEGHFQALFKDRKHELNTDNFPNFHKFVKPTENLDFITIKSTEFTKGSHILATFTAVPYLYYIRKDSKWTCGIQLHMDDLAVIHPNQPVLSPRRTRIKDIFANKGRKVHPLTNQPLVPRPSIEQQIHDVEDENSQNEKPGMSKSTSPLASITKQPQSKSAEPFPVLQRKQSLAYNSNMETSQYATEGQGIVTPTKQTNAYNYNMDTSQYAKEGQGITTPTNQTTAYNYNVDSSQYAKEGQGIPAPPKQTHSYDYNMASSQYAKEGQGGPTTLPKRARTGKIQGKESTTIFQGGSSNNVRTGGARQKIVEVMIPTEETVEDVQMGE